MSEPSAVNGDCERRLNEVLAEYMQRIDRGEVVDRETLLAQHPDLARELREYFDDTDRIERMAGPATAETHSSQSSILAPTIL
jgi:hypothetical protein